MRKKFIIILLAFVTLTPSLAQEVGFSFSYFIPRNGYFSTPISPFSFRGVGVELNRYIAIETGFSLYRMSGLNVIDLPFESRKPLTGPNFTLFVPLEFVIQLKGRQAQLDFKAGGFVFHGFDQKLDYGNIDRAIRAYESWDFANADLDFDNKPGYGYHFGTEFTFYPARQFGISLECNYLIGQSAFPLSGSYVGGTLAGGSETIAADYPDAKIDLTGLEFSIGVIFTGR